MSALPPFVYEPLLGTNSIRILHLASAEQGSALRGTLREISLSSRAREDLFFALSYVWGEPAPTPDYYIECDGSRLDVTPNLHNALHRFHDQAFSRHVALWVDAICINQADEQEKNCQVRLMWKIYGKSALTYVWLGPSWPGISLAVEAIKKLEAAHDAGRRAALLKDTGSHSNLHELIQAHDLPLPDSPEMGALMTLLENPWFERSWIYQEIVASRESIMTCGEDAWQWTDLYHACLSLDYFGIRQKLTGRHQKRRYAFVIEMGTAHDLIQNPQPGQRPPRLTKVLANCRDRKATDARDKVFAFLGISSDGHYPILAPDYAKPVAEVYRDVTRHLVNLDNWGMMRTGILKGEKKLNLRVEAAILARLYDSEGRDLFEDSGLEILCLTPGIGISNGLPSWVPDWRLPRHTGGQYLCERNTNDTRRFRASGLIRKAIVDRRFFASEEGFFKMDCDPELIGVGGFHFATVGAMACPLLPHGDDPEKADPDSFLEVWGDNGQWRKLADSVCVDGIYEPTGQTADFALMVTRVVDYFPTSVRLDSDGNTTHWPAQIQLQESTTTDTQLLASLCEAAENELLQMTINFCHGRRLVVTDNGYMALVPAQTAVGDQICIFFGSDVPFVLRPQENGDFLLVGACFVHGIMDGEAEVIQCGGKPATLQQAINMPTEEMKQECYRVMADQKTVRCGPDPHEADFPWKYFFLR